MTYRWVRGGTIVATGPDYTVTGDESYLELTRSDLVTLLAKLDDNDDCTMVGHDNIAVWKVVTVTALEDDAPVVVEPEPEPLDIVDRGE